jgi:hypothetical protein
MTIATIGRLMKKLEIIDQLSAFNFQFSVISFQFSTDQSGSAEN